MNISQGDTYREGYYHFLNPGKLEFNEHTRNDELFQQSAGLADVRQLEWFADGFNRADIIDEALVITDLRMGFEDNYVFRHKVAIEQNGSWQEVTSEQLPRQLNGEDLATFKEMFYEHLD